MQRDDAVCVGHMIDAAREALDLAAGKTKEEFDSDRTLRLALTHLLQIVGEAARSISPGFRQAHPGIPWKDITGMRHKVVRDYMQVDEEVVWDTLREELGPLVEALERAVRPEEPRP